MYNFEYQRPSSVADAASFIAAGGQALAGGQTLLASMKQRLIAPERLIDLGDLADLRGVRVDGSTVTVGAMTRHVEVATNADVQRLIPGLASLANGIGDRQVRARGTMGGSVANNDPAACYPAAVLGLGATVITDRREIAADDFFQGIYTTALDEGEIITAIRFPVPQAAGYAKFKQPASRFALVGVFVSRGASGVRVAITGAGNGVFRHAGLEAALSSHFNVSAVDGVTVDDSELNGDLHACAAYRAQLIKVQTKRALERAQG